MHILTPVNFINDYSIFVCSQNAQCSKYFRSISYNGAIYEQNIFVNILSGFQHLNNSVSQEIPNHKNIYLVRLIFDSRRILRLTSLQEIVNHLIMPKIPCQKLTTSQLSRSQQSTKKDNTFMACRYKICKQGRLEQHF